MPIDIFQTSGLNHDIGISVGRRFAALIHQTFDNHEGLNREVLPYHRSEQGQQRYLRLVDLHELHYPEYMQELAGIAEGAQRSFEELFLMNLRGEYASYIKTQDEKGCSTSSVLTGAHALFGHNEDGLEVFKGKLFFLTITPAKHPAFTALTYPGFLPGNSFGFNNEGICFAINNVHPKNINEGIGRHFIARSLFEARDINDAIAKVTRPGRASGFNYTLASIKERRIVDVEVSVDRHATREINGSYFHSNHYFELEDIEQTITQTSNARKNRANSIMQKEQNLDGSSILKVLSDRQDSAYPLYRNNASPDDRVTLLSCLFDLDRRSMAVFDSRPETMDKKIHEFFIC